MNNEHLTSVGEDAALEEGVPEEATGVRSRTNGRSRLSVISQKYDIDGDGVLDEAQQAMRDMDKSGRGFLTNDKVYRMMQQQLDLQKQMFNMKRIVIGLACFAVVLALSNLGTAWAAAVLAKETKVDQGSANMMTKDGTQMVGTQAKVPMHEAQNIEDTERLRRFRRELDLVDVGDDVEGDGFEVTRAVADDIYNDCDTGSVVTRLKYYCSSGSARGGARYSDDLQCSSTSYVPGTRNSDDDIYTYGNVVFTCKKNGRDRGTCFITGLTSCDTELATLGRPYNDVCFEGAECASGICVDGTPQNQGTCGCSDDEDCESGTSCDSARGVCAYSVCPARAEETQGAYCSISGECKYAPNCCAGFADFLYEERCSCNSETGMFDFPCQIASMLPTCGSSNGYTFSESEDCTATCGRINAFTSATECDPWEDSTTCEQDCAVLPPEV